MKKCKRLAAVGLAAAVALCTFTGCGKSAADEKVIIYSNADDEAVTAMKNALDNNGFRDQYIFQSFGTPSWEESFWQREAILRRI